jgi:hypothetical protein
LVVTIVEPAAVARTVTGQEGPVTSKDCCSQTLMGLRPKRSGWGGARQDVGRPPNMLIAFARATAYRRLGTARRLEPFSRTWRPNGLCRFCTTTKLQRLSRRHVVAMSQKSSLISEVLTSNNTQPAVS